MSAACEILVKFTDRAELDDELSGSISAGGLFARGTWDVEKGQLCTAILIHPDNDQRLSLPASVVWLTDEGVGLALSNFDQKLLEQIQGFAKSEPAETSTDGRPKIGEKNLRTRTRGGAGDVQKRVRGLSGAEQLKVARTGELSERVALERVYGKAVWEALLRNPRISQPEVARIARKGTVPRPLIELIVDNAGWVKSPQIRRALLSNPRMSRELVEKVLRAAPRGELKLMPKQMSYPAAVREIAARLLS